METVNAHIKQTSGLSAREIPVKSLFLAKYGRFPGKICMRPTGSDVVFHVKSVLDRLNNEYHIQNESPIIQRYLHRCSKKYFICEQLVLLSDIEGVMIHFYQCRWVTNYTNNSKKIIEPDYTPDDHFLVIDQINLFYLSEHENFVQNLAYNFSNDQTLHLQKPKLATLSHIVKHKNRCTGWESFHISCQTHIRKPFIDNLAVSYGGEEFLKIHQKIVTWLNKEDASGLTLLHGTPGSGKFDSLIKIK